MVTERTVVPGDEPGGDAARWRPGEGGGWTDEVDLPDWEWEWSTVPRGRGRVAAPGPVRSWVLGVLIPGSGVVIVGVRAAGLDELVGVEQLVWLVDPGCEWIRELVVERAWGAVPRWVDEVSPSGVIAGGLSVRALRVGIAEVAGLLGGRLGGDLGGLEGLGELRGLR